MKLKFGRGNAKLDKKIYTFSISAGVTCPGANICKSKVVIKDGRMQIKDGKNTKFRCFSASNEVVFPNVYNSRRKNLMALRSVGRSVPQMTLLIHHSLPKNAKYIRLHVAGDFFSQVYFDAWLRVAMLNPSITFYAYTKSIPYWLARIDSIPSNFILTASLGSRFDDLIIKNKLKCVRVVFSETEACKLGLPVDHDDSHALNSTGDFALLLHGVQPKGEASMAKIALGGKGSYSRRIYV